MSTTAYTIRIEDQTHTVSEESELDAKYLAASRHKASDDGPEVGVGVEEIAQRATIIDDSVEAFSFESQRVTREDLPEELRTPADADGAFGGVDVRSVHTEYGGVFYGMLVSAEDVPAVVDAIDVEPHEPHEIPARAPRTPIYSHTAAFASKLDMRDAATGLVLTQINFGSIPKTIPILDLRQKTPRRCGRRYRPAFFLRGVLPPRPETLAHRQSLAPPPPSGDHDASPSGVRRSAGCLSAPLKGQFGCESLATPSSRHLALLRAVRPFRACGSLPQCGRSPFRAYGTAPPS